MAGKGIPAATYSLALAAVAGLGLVASISPLAHRIDNYAADFLFAIHKPSAWQPESIILAMDDATFVHMGGVSFIRREIAQGLQILASAKPKVVAIDVLLADRGDDEQNRELAAAIRACGNVILPAQLMKTRWEEPLPMFVQTANAIGHVEA